MLSPEEYSGLQVEFGRLPADLLAHRLEKHHRKHPDDARVAFLLGAARHRLGRLEEALRAFDAALSLAPRHLQALNAKAGILAMLGRGQEARSLFESAIAEFPTEPDLLANLGYLIEKEPAEQPRALECYEHALRLDPSHKAARTNRGFLLTQLKRLPEAVSNNRELVRAHPEFAMAHYNLAQTLLASMKPAEALEACDTAIALRSDWAEAHLTRALALAELGRLDESAVSLERVRSLGPAAMERAGDVFEPDQAMPPPPPDPQTVYLHRGLRHFAHCEWTRYGAFLDDFLAALDRALEQAVPVSDASFAYYLLATPLDSMLHRRLMENFAGQFERRAASNKRPMPAGATPSPRKIRIGYVSPDYRDHLNARLTLPIYRLHDRQRFEVHCYSLHADDGSDIRKNVVAAADRFVDVSNRDEADIAARIRGDGIDVLVDLGGMTTHTRPGLFAFRPAPVQASYLGFPGTMGAGYIQYRISDRIATPAEQRAYWAENLVMLPDTFYIYDNSEPLAALALTRAEYGLPESATVFCAFHNYYKVDPVVFEAWIRILKRVPDAVLWLSGASALAVEYLRQEARARGIDGSRLVAAPVESRERYRARFALADLYLDTRLFTAMTTACDALWAGLPLITCPGSAFPSRVSASLLNAAGLDDCVLPDLAAYENRAVELATNPPMLQALRARVAANRQGSALFDAQARVRQLEQAFEGMWQRHVAGKPPEDFDVAR